MNILCCGRRAEGRTTLAYYLLQRRHSGIIIIDSRGMIDGYIVHDVDELEDAMREKKWSRGTPIVYRMMLTDAEKEISDVCDFLFPPGDSHHWRAFGLLIDEAGEFQSFNSISPPIKRAIAQHYYKEDKYSVTIVQTAHRLPEFNGKSKTLMDELYMFATSNPRDLDILTEYTADPSIADIVRNLPPHHCARIKFARQADGQPQYEVWDDPQKWFVSLEKRTETPAVTPIPPEPQKKVKTSFLGRKYYAS